MVHSSRKYQNCLIFHICYHQGTAFSFQGTAILAFTENIWGEGRNFDSWLKLNSEGVINPTGFLGATCRLLLNCKPTFTNNHDIGFAEITHNDFNQGAVSEQSAYWDPLNNLLSVCVSVKQRASRVLGPQPFDLSPSLPCPVWPKNSFCRVLKIYFLF